MPTPAELVHLLANPSESLTVEYKSWLTLSESHGKATLAKAAIALANHGGGIVVLGLRPQNNDGGLPRFPAEACGLGPIPRKDDIYQRRSQ